MYPEVKTFGNTNQVKITTNYMINDLEADEILNMWLNVPFLLVSGILYSMTWVKFSIASSTYSVICSRASNLKTDALSDSLIIILPSFPLTFVNTNDLD